MNRKQIERFVQKAYPLKSVQIKYFIDKSPHSSLAETCSMESKIYLNLASLRLKEYRANENVLIKAALLHELGHIDKFHIGCLASFELEAQLFAIRTAAKLKMWKVYKKTIYWLWTWGISDNPIYKEAYNLSLEDNECKQYYKRFGYEIP